MQFLLLSTLLISGLRVSQAVKVYLVPPPGSPPSTLSAQRASLVLSRHVGLESFELLGNSYSAEYGERSFIGQGEKKALLLTIDEVEGKEILPPSLELSFNISNIQSVSSLSSLLSTYLQRAEHEYTHVYSSEAEYTPAKMLDVLSLSPSAKSSRFLSELTSLNAFLESPSLSSFAAIELTGLASLRLEHGRTSQHYQTALAATRAAVESALAQSPPINFAFLTFSAPPTRSMSKRQAQAQQSQSPLPDPAPLPQEPIGSISTCFSSVAACTNVTNSCSGRGECLEASKAGRTCFVCACGKTQTAEGKTNIWVGEKCERKDISGPFVLITGTVVVLILLIAGSVSLLYGIGGQSLPSTLLGVVVGVKKE